MRSRRTGLFGLAVGLWATALPAQSSMTFAQFATQVEANHPAAVQAALVRAQARAALAVEFAQRRGDDEAQPHAEIV